MEPVRCYTLALESKSCTLPSVFILTLQYLFFYKQILEYEEIPLPSPWKKVAGDICREHVRMTVGSRNRTFLLFASTFNYFGQKYIFGGNMKDLLADLGRGEYVSPHVPHMLH
jgi:hypothetical protein